MSRFLTRALFWRGALSAILWWKLAQGRTDSWGVGLEGAHLRLHVLDARRPVAAAVRVAEQHVARMFGLRLATEP